MVVAVVVVVPLAVVLVLVPQVGTAVVVLDGVRAAAACVAGAVLLVALVVTAVVVLDGVWVGGCSCWR